MGAEYVDGQPIPTWKLINGICKESLAFETAQREGIPEILIQRAEELYNSAYRNQISKKKDQKRLSELYKMKNPSEVATVKCVLIAAREQPAPSTIGASSVYIMLRPDKKFYVGQTDDLEGRVRAHRLKEGMENASFLYFLVAVSIACQLETLLINQLPNYGFQLTNIADGSIVILYDPIIPEPSTA
ncbi:DNA mismatch repair ATPase msh1 [Datura stramonium]|uniref:DNA mismatch repair ATPase msh1 n=1 Tax=Datura stramonium TaxID=4076 RepID=A0ABS8V093_DATST|nr:DNA mismatch repair ATPase msh1 [Datura stramonium]